MKGFEIADINFHQPMVILPGTYTFSCKATPVGNSITFRVGTLDFIIDGLMAGVYQTGIKKTFTIETQQTNFYLSRTIGDKIFEPQLEHGTVATTPGPHILDGPEEIERAGIRITSEMAQIYASKDEMYSEISITANQITQSVSDISGRVSTVEQTISGITQRISDAEGNISTVEQTVNSWSSTITSAGKIASQILQDGENVKITATNIILEGAITASGYFKILQDGSIEATNGKFTGTIHANSGTIGGWILNYHHIGVEDSNPIEGSVGGVSMYDDFIRFYRKYTIANSPYGDIAPDSYVWSGIGENVLPASSGARAVGRLENLEQQGYWDQKSRIDYYYDYQSWLNAGSPTPATFFYWVYDDSLHSTGHEATYSYYVDPNYFTYGGYLERIQVTVYWYEWEIYYGTTNIGLVIDVRGAAENLAIDILSGSIAGMAIRTRQISSGTTLTNADVFVSCYNTSAITVYLPSNPQTGKVVFIKRVNSAGITINGNGKSIYWQGTSASSRSHGDDIGDTDMFVFDGQYWMYHTLIG